MAIVLAAIIIWLLIHIYVYLPKKCNPIESAFIFMAVSIMNNMFCSIITENMKWAVPYETPEGFTVLILQRTVIIPLLFLIVIHLFLLAKSITGRILIVMASFGIVVGMEELCMYFHVMKYVDNRWAVPLIHTPLLFLTGLIALTLFRPVLKRGVTMR
ncbi:hypothetical protein SLL00_16270 [Metabacillus indicus]|uniref:hypothetical protein n=1 Tax=Metabacillus indicus TaxID=246786 RepID=UPI0024928C36|nr:hypothetical protein [Metabacillus indicus]MDX8291368.1 hypothetical protein [Metabacillus indicus]